MPESPPFVLHGPRYLQYLPRRSQAWIKSYSMPNGPIGPHFGLLPRIALHCRLPLLTATGHLWESSLPCKNSVPLPHEIPGPRPPSPLFPRRCPLSGYRSRLFLCLRPGRESPIEPPAQTDRCPARQACMNWSGQIR